MFLISFFLNSATMFKSWSGPTGPVPPGLVLSRLFRKYEGTRVVCTLVRSSSLFNQSIILIIQLQLFQLTSFNGWVATICCYL